MNLIDIIYEPYTIAIISALIFTFIVYLFIKEKDQDDENKKPKYKTLLISFVASLLVFLGIIYGLRTLSNKKLSGDSGMKGGGSSISVADLSERLNIADNDVDFGLLES